MNSPVVIVSRYRPDNHRPLAASVENLESCFGTSAWQPSLAQLQRGVVSPASTPASLGDINDVMEQYLHLAFEFTHPVAIDFRDIQTGELASTEDSLMVFEYGQGLRNLLDSLQNMSVRPDEVEKLKSSIREVKASLDDLHIWVGEQRTQQLFEESLKTIH